MHHFASFFTATLAAVGARAAPAAGPFITSDLARRQFTPTSQGTHDDYFYSWWTDRKFPATYTNGAGGSYSIEWKSGGNFVGGKGWRTGGPKTIQYSGTFSPVNNSNGYLTVYGWTKYPLVEYYIMENYGEYDPGSTAIPKGQVTSDGSVYKLYEDTRFNEGSIDGTQTFPQFWAIRENKRTGGTITSKNIFDAWRNANMTLGTTFDYMLLATEGWWSTGSASINIETAA